jgi:hypothetical protein
VFSRPRYLSESSTRAATWSTHPARGSNGLFCFTPQRIRFFEEKANGKSKGYALVEFLSPEGATAAKARRPTTPGPVPLLASMRILPRMSQPALCSWGGKALSSHPLFRVAID